MPTRWTDFSIEFDGFLDSCSHGIRSQLIVTENHDFSHLFDQPRHQLRQPPPVFTWINTWHKIKGQWTREGTAGTLPHPTYVVGKIGRYTGKGPTVLSERLIDWYPKFLRRAKHITTGRGCASPVATAGSKLRLACSWRDISTMYDFFVLSHSYTTVMLCAAKCPVVGVDVSDGWEASEGIGWERIGVEWWSPHLPTRHTLPLSRKSDL